MKRLWKLPVAIVGLAIFCLAISSTEAAVALAGWNNLGMHCLDSDYSVFSILPPYNTIEAQLIVNGKIVGASEGYSVTYQAVADPDGSFNSTSIGKGNFYTYTPWLYGALAPDMGLAGWAMPGTNNTPQAMLYEAHNQPAEGVTTPVKWFRAEGIPIMPFDDRGQKNEYPLMRLVARDKNQAVIATSDIVLPVSDEMDCRACHASGSQAAAKPAAGWVYVTSAERDYRLNILRLHDEREFRAHPTQYQAALATGGFHAAGLYANVVSNGTPILCASCHKSEALPGSGIAGIPPLTASMHSSHASVKDPEFGVVLDDLNNRASCYRCHPGSATKCLRGAMGKAIAADGSMEMQCQSCHGNMSTVGAATRTGWFMEPTCQNCHSGTATHNNGQIRYTSAFSDNKGTLRVAVDQTFATTPNTPAPGLSLYRFSVGHGGLQCSACHGSTHAEFPSSTRNDNIRNQQMQGHAGVLSECSVCHSTVPQTVNGGPHGMHPMGSSWVSRHPDVVEHGGAAQCQACHGKDYRGTVLSQMQADRTISGQKLFKGAIVGCYMCHNGPDGEGHAGNAPTASNITTNTLINTPVAMKLPATGTSLLLRIISQAEHGAVGLSNGIATYFPDSGFLGTDRFTFAAYNGSKNSTLATGTVTVLAIQTTAPSISLQPQGKSVAAGAAVTFSVTATGTAPLQYQWYKDGVKLVNGANISGATATTLKLAKASPSDAGKYYVVVSNGTPPAAVSAYASLTVVSDPAPAPPRIVTPPSSQTAAAGASTTFTVTATGTAPLSYQWLKESAPLANGGQFSGVATASLKISSLAPANAGNYRVIVSNSAGSVTSVVAVLKVRAPSLAVTLAKPENGAVFKTEKSVAMTASVSPANAGTQVQFYDSATLLGTDASAPYTMSRRFSAGTHTLTARAITPAGASTTSAPVKIAVTTEDDD